MNHDLDIEEITAQAAALAKTMRDCREIQERIKTTYTHKIEVESKPYQDKFRFADQALDALIERPGLAEAICPFKPGDFVKKAHRNDEWFEFHSANIRFDADEHKFVCIYKAYEIRWNGVLAAYPSTLYQDSTIKVSETEDKRLLKRVRRRVIERLEMATECDVEVEV
jgi:hypothetical protein